MMWCSWLRCHSARIILTIRSCYPVIHRTCTQLFLWSAMQCFDMLTGIRMACCHDAYLVAQWQEMWQVHSSRGRLRRVVCRRIHSVQHHLISRCRSVFDTCDSFMGRGEHYISFECQHLQCAAVKVRRRDVKITSRAVTETPSAIVFFKVTLQESNTWSHIRITGKVPHPGCNHLMMSLAIWDQCQE